jgi:hypothetical protein
LWGTSPIGRTPKLINRQDGGSAATQHALEFGAPGARFAEAGLLYQSKSPGIRPPEQASDFGAERRDCIFAPFPQTAATAGGRALDSGARACASGRLASPRMAIPASRTAKTMRK